MIRTKFADVFTELAAEFRPNEVKSLKKGGATLRYITARTAMNRLDEVLGPENWWDSYTPHAESVYCQLTIRLPDGSTLTKSDAGGYAGMSDQGDDDKSGYSDAFKRAAVKFGVARYLYRDGVPDLADEPAPQAPPATAPAPEKKAPRPLGDVIKSAADYYKVEPVRVARDLLGECVADGKVADVNPMLLDVLEIVKHLSSLYIHQPSYVMGKLKALGAPAKG